MADHHGGVTAVSDQLRVQLQADQEKEEDHADLAEGIELAGTLAGGKTCAACRGKSRPNRLGPSMMPAIISPMTCGWRILVQKTPMIRDRPRIRAT